MRARSIQLEGRQQRGSIAAVNPPTLLAGYTACVSFPSLLCIDQYTFHWFFSNSTCGEGESPGGELELRIGGRVARGCPTHTAPYVGGTHPPSTPGWTPKSIQKSTENKVLHKNAKSHQNGAPGGQ